MLHVHRAERTARLADGLAAVLATPLSDPFAAEVVAVPAKGVERWLAQRLSTVLGAGAGGALYVTGAVAYHRRRPDPFPSVFGYHEVFHAFVCAAATCHYVAIALLLVR